MLDSRADRNKLREVVNKAVDKKTITKEDAGFVVVLAERFRADIDRKVKQMHMVQGEINQLQTNEQIIIDLIGNMLAAADRDEARIKTAAKLRGKDQEDQEKPKRGRPKK